MRLDEARNALSSGAIAAPPAEHDMTVGIPTHIRQAMRDLFRDFVGWPSPTVVPRELGVYYDKAAITALLEESNISVFAIDRNLNGEWAIWGEPKYWPVPYSIGPVLMKTVKIVLESAAIWESFINWTDGFKAEFRKLVLRTGIHAKVRREFQSKPRAPP